MSESIEQIKTENGFNIDIDALTAQSQLNIIIDIDYDKKVIFHWGLYKHSNPKWHVPPSNSWPKGSISYKNKAVQSPFISIDGHKRLEISLDNYKDYSFIPFALYFPDSNQWDNNNGQNYLINLTKWEKSRKSIPRISKGSETSKSPLDYFKNKLEKGEMLFSMQHHVESEGDVCTIVINNDNNLRLLIASDIKGHLQLHWGVINRFKSQWLPPDQSIRPINTTSVCSSGVETIFEDEDGYKTISIIAKEDEAPDRVAFVIRKDYDQWLKKNGVDFLIPFGALIQKETPIDNIELSQIANEIIERENSNNSWTLMHRFNLCHDLINRCGENISALAYLYVWLRYSELRQLDWQRNYNTQPRELAHAMDRLSLRIAWTYIDMPKARQIAALMLSTLGPGGDGQRIRDEILQIMHRHRIKEVTGSFLEEWHQKLHNNTTPDDVVICEAYLAFLRSDGRHDTFYQTLNHGGVTKTRLETFERPIKTPPDFVHYLKDTLIHEFDSFLLILKKVHKGTDLQSAIENSGYILSDYIKGRLWFLFDNRFNQAMPMEEQIGTVYFIRKNLYEILNHDRDSQRVRAILFLDIALMEYMRKIIEGRINIDFQVDTLMKLLGLTIDNWILTKSQGDQQMYDPILLESKRHLDKLIGNVYQGFSSDTALHIYSLIQKISRFAAGSIDALIKLLQEKAQYLGRAFGAQAWTINLFAEEVARSQIEFIISILIKYLEPKLRQTADLGSWQVISEGSVTGKICVVPTISDRSAKGDSSNGLIIVTDKVNGDEEPQEGIVAIITKRSVDIVSHLAIRTRNRGIVFAACYSPEIFEDLKTMNNKQISIKSDPSGDILISDTFIEANLSLKDKPSPLHYIVKKRSPRSKSYVISESDFTEEYVGEKALNLKILRSKIPQWIKLPNSIAVPFGTFENILNHEINKDIQRKYQGLLSKHDRQKKIYDADLLLQLRNSIIELTLPSQFMESLTKTMETSLLKSITDIDTCSMCIKRVFASIWNDRAYLGRQPFGIKDVDISMAVLIQEVIDAQYAFVIHTNNPVTRDKNEIYAEVVIGLGETLVGNYPGQSLGFTYNKNDKKSKIVSYPNKEIGLYGKGLIFRSDSNAEDITGYSGAGLYDSILESIPVTTLINYSEERLLWDIDFRNNLISKIAEVGVIIEEIFGTAQDIEGVYSHGEYYVVQSRPQV